MPQMRPSVDEYVKESMEVKSEFQKSNYVTSCPFKKHTSSACPVAILGTLRYSGRTPRQNVDACARLSISGLIFSHTFQSKSPARFILCAACGSAVLLYAARVFDYFVVIEIAFMDNQAQITETISRLDSKKVR